MTDEERARMKELTKLVEQQSVHINQLLMSVAGSAGFDHPGLLARVRDLEKSRLLMAEQFNQRFDKFEDKVDEKFDKVDRLIFALETIQSKTTWSFVLKVVAGGTILISWWKFGYDALVKMVTDIINK